MGNPIIVIMGDSTGAGLDTTASALASFMSPNAVTICVAGHRLDQIQTDWENSAYYNSADIVATIVCGVINDIAAKATDNTIATRKANLTTSIRTGTSAAQAVLNRKIPILFNAPNPCKQRWTDIGFNAGEVTTAQASWQTYIDGLVNDADNGVYAIKDHVAIGNDGSGNLAAKWNYADDHVHGNNAYRIVQAYYNIVQLQALKISAVLMRGRLNFATIGDSNARAATLNTSIGNPKNGTTTVGSLVSGGGGKILIDSRMFAPWNSVNYLTDDEMRALLIAP